MSRKPSSRPQSERDRPLNYRQTWHFTALLAVAAVLCFGHLSPAAAEEVSAAVNWSNGKAYFFNGNSYIRYDIAADQADPGYPKTIDGTNWPGLTFDDIDATLNWGNGKAYFFSGNSYTRYNIAADQADSGYPKTINGNSWPGLTFDTIDAALEWGNGKAYFFSGNSYTRYDIAADRADSGYPRPINGNSWPGLTFDTIDAAVNWGNGKAYFFSGNSYVRYDIAADRADPGYPKATDANAWPGLTFGAAPAAPEPVHFAGTDHHYELVKTRLTYAQALAEAATRTYNGMQGYLATVTAQEENDFLHQTFSPEIDVQYAWISASDAQQEGNFTWDAGPESGQSLVYGGWSPGEPNNYTGREHYAGFGKPNWNDLPDWDTWYYFVEYGDTEPYPAAPSGPVAADTAESYQSFNNGTSGNSPWHFNATHSAANTIDGSGLTGEGLDATHSSANLNVIWFAPDNQKYGVLRYTFNQAQTFQGIALWQDSNFRGGFSSNNFDVWVLQNGSWVQVLQGQSMVNPPTPAANLFDFPSPMAGVTEIVIDMHSTWTTDSRMEVGIGEFRAY